MFENPFGVRIMDFQKLQTYVIDLLSRNLHEHLYYHDVNHTLDVLESATNIATQEGITDPETMLILQTAALFHDSGLISTYSGHEEVSCKYAETILPDYGFTAEQIGRICKLIMKTKMPQAPEDLLEMILCDADLDYLGRDDYKTISDRLFEEWRIIGRISSREEWQRVQIQFLTEHHYWTATNRTIRQPEKEMHLKKLLMEKNA